MYGKLLVTATLLDSFDFASSAPPSWKARAMMDFVSKIRREQIDFPAWVHKGEDLEAQVQAVCNTAKSRDDLKVGSDNFQKVTNACYGGTFQNKLKLTMEIDGTKCFFFGYSDVEKKDTTIDIKTCLAWKTKSKYLNKSQHLIYLMINGNAKFEYVVVEWEDENLPDIKSVHIIPYNSPGKDILKRMIAERVTNMFGFIRQNNLWQDYFHIFSKN